MAIDQTKLDALLGQFVSDLGATFHAANVVVGDRLGLYRALADGGAATSVELAERTATTERYVREWLRGQVAGGYVTYDAATDRYLLTEEQAFAMAAADGLSLPGAFQLATATVKDEPKITEAFRSGAGVGWHEHHADVFAGCERFFRPNYAAHLVSSWLPALDGVVEKLDGGASVADIGCGFGTSTILMAQAYPRSTFAGFDYHDASIEAARKAAAEAGVGDRCRFEVAGATDYPGAGYDLVAAFDALHDMGDPVGAAAHVRRSLAPDGTWLLVEPYAGNSAEDNFNPVGRIYYGASTMLCVPASLAQDVGLALGAQAGEPRLREVVTAGGFHHFRRAAETPFNLVFEARP
ncbi:MAG: class I SAM-dependent methyltransferase [Pseudonocardia sp.]|nr:class I SAM-dependent methyltransferase [Pseudonocardia sp.]